MTSIKQCREFFEAVLPGNFTFLDECLDWIRDNLEPDDVFSRDVLKAWAEDNGYVLSDD